MSYLSTLNSEQRKNIDIVIRDLNKAGITNVYAQAGILAVISKESSFKRLSELGYKNTSNSRIRDKFSRLRNLSDSELNALKADEQAFFNAIYGKRYGNDGYTSSGFSSSWYGPFKDGNDGYRYRGAGLNQITFKGNFKKVGDTIGIDLVAKPELLRKIDTASKASVAYFQNTFKRGWSSAHKDYYNANDINDFKTVLDGALAMYHTNAGLGKPMYSKNVSESTGGLRKTIERAPEFVEYIKTDYKRTDEKKKSSC
jgi:predicted chitinase